MTTDASIVRAPTCDGGTVALKRLPANGTPVILLHGLAVNADIWNLPETRGKGFHFRSLAQVLHEAGHDVWLANLRGHGAPDMLSTPPPAQRDWCVDDFVVQDMPAIVNHVRGATGRRPFVLGASMGAMTLAGYLQGTCLRTEGDEERLVADATVAGARQAELAGAVLAEFPAALRWPEALYGRDGRLRWRLLLRNGWRSDGSVNAPFEMLSRWGWLHAIVAAAGDVPLAKMRGNPARASWITALPAPLAERLRALEHAAGQAVLGAAGTFTGAHHHRAEILIRGRRFVVDNMKAGVLRQLAKCVQSGAFVSWRGTPDHVYSDHYDQIALPTLVVQGGRDRIANAEIVRSAFYERIAAPDRALLFYPDIAHGEIEAAPVASERIYPEILRWIARRDPGAGAARPG